MPDLFRLDIAEAVATLTLDRPERHNLMEAGDLPVLEGLLGQVEEAREVRVLVVAGAGEKTFCSGFDIAAIGRTDWRERPLDRALDRLEDLPVPTVCALNGDVYGGGADLALACDFRLGRRGMRMVVPPARLGVHYHVGGVRRFVERLGLGPAKRLLLAGETVADEALLSIGFLDHLVAADALAATTAELAATLAGMAPLAVQGMKRTLNQAARGGIDMDEAEAAVLACLQSKDLSEGTAAFAEKRAPVFTGE